MHDSASVKCDFVPNSDDYRCQRCGRTAKAKSPPFAICRAAGIGTHAKSPPSLITKAANFAASAARHVAAGMPRATDEEVARRFAICQGCEHFDGKACRQCGCPIVRERQFISKLSWANEKCPAGKWGSGQSPETA